MHFFYSFEIALRVHSINQKKKMMIYGIQKRHRVRGGSGRANQANDHADPISSCHCHVAFVHAFSLPPIHGRSPHQNSLKVPWDPSSQMVFHKSNQN